MRVALSISALTLIAVASVPASAQQITGVPGSPSATTTIDGAQIPPPPQKFEGKIERNAAQSTPYWPRTRCAAQGCAQHSADHDGRHRFRCLQHLRRRDPNADSRPDRRQRPALHQLQLDGAMLADARGTDHGTQPSFDGLWGRRRAVDGLPRLQQHHDPRQGDDRQDPQGQWLLDLLVWQGPQHP